MKILILTSVLVPLVLLGSCRDGMELPAETGSGHVYAELSCGTVPDGIAGYQFEDGRLTHMYDSFHRTAEGYSVKMESLSGTLYIVAWEGEQAPFESPAAGTGESEWLRTEVSSGDGSAGVFYTGSTGLQAASAGAVPVLMKRGVAMVEIRTDVAGEAEIRSAVVRNVFPGGYLFPQEEMSGMGQGGTADVPMNPCAYIHEQNNPDIRVEVDAVVDGKEYLLETSLPERIVRNTHYTVTLRKDRVEQEVELTVSQWGDGGTVDGLPDRNGYLAVDADRSMLPEGASVEDGGRVLVLPHVPVDFILKVSGNEKLDLVSGEGYLLDVQEIPSSGTGDMNMYRVRKALYAPGVSGVDAVLQFRRSGLSHIYPDDVIVLRLSPNPTSLEGEMFFGSEDYTYDFGRYVDNELGVFSLPEGYGISLEFAEGEDRWMKLEHTGENRWRLLGGWRPNDTTANGRMQSGTIVISDGTGREESYTVVRRNYGLPVTWLHGIWWCKYNAMGDSRSFGDQILSSDDPAVNAGKTLAEYLGSCSAEEYRNLWQWAYQGSSGQGMQVIDNDGILVMDNFNAASSEHINKLPADALSPDGYELPSMDDFNRIFDAVDYIWLMWDGTHRLKTPWEGHDIIRRVQKRRNDVTVGSVNASDLIYIAMSSQDFPEHEPVVWYGPGAQWNADGIKHSGHYNNILFGVYSPQGQGWYMSGAMNALYMSKNGAGTKDTRILRFRKSDVEYIY